MESSLRPGAFCCQVLELSLCLLSALCCWIQVSRLHACEWWAIFSDAVAARIFDKDTMAKVKILKSDKERDGWSPVAVRSSFVVFFPPVWKTALCSAGFLEEMIWYYGGCFLWFMMVYIINIQQPSCRKIWTSSGAGCRSGVETLWGRLLESWSRVREAQYAMNQPVFFLNSWLIQYLFTLYL